MLYNLIKYFEDIDTYMQEMVMVNDIEFNNHETSSYDQASLLFPCHTRCMYPSVVAGHALS